MVNYRQRDSRMTNSRKLLAPLQIQRLPTIGHAPLLVFVPIFLYRLNDWLELLNYSLLLFLCHLDESLTLVLGSPSQVRLTLGRSISLFSLLFIEF